MLQIRHGCAVVFNYWAGARGRHSEEQADIARAAQKVAYSGMMTDGAEKRLRKAISLLLQSSPERIIYNPVSNSHHPFTINFITLTCSDSTIRQHKELQKTLLEPFLRWQRGRGATSYIWKMELQQRGQPHYHITTNQFIHFQEIRDYWNNLQRKAGYLDSYARKTKHFNPNSTDVHAVKDVQDLEAYLVKYIVKGVSQSGAAQKGKVWDCSKNLKVPYFYTELTQHNLDLLRSTAQRYKELEHCAIARIKDPTKVLDAVQLQEYQQFISSL